MKRIALIALFCLSQFITNAQDSWDQVCRAGSGTLVVNYFENFPFCYNDSQGNLTGVEVDIVNAFVKWVKENKKLDVNVKFVPIREFKDFYAGTKAAANGTIGCGSVTITKERSKEVMFTAPYLRNISVLISGFEIPTLNSFAEMPTKLEGMTACVIKGTVAEKELFEIKKFHFPNMIVKYVQSPADITNDIAREPKKFFGYSDLISYWAFTKANGGKLKMHKAVNRENEKFGFILPLKSDWYPVLQEFFEGGFGFTSNILYKEILERHLGYEVIKSVEMN